MERCGVQRSVSGEAVVCRERLCPCLASTPDLCEVEVETGDCRCRVALAAAQEGLCDAGEQLLVSPTGQSPQLMKMNPLFTQIFPSFLYGGNINENEWKLYSIDHRL